MDTFLFVASALSFILLPEYIYQLECLKFSRNGRRSKKSQLISSTYSFSTEKEPMSEIDGGAYMQLIGNTPLVELRSLSRITGCRVMAKMESCNPGGSGKDRAAKNMLKQAIIKKLLVKNKGVYHIVEGTSGSTGISLAYICASLGTRTAEDGADVDCEWNKYSMNKFQLHVVLPDDQAAEKTQLLQKLGVHVVIVPTAAISNPNHYVHTARRLANELGGYFINQFENLDNYGVHFAETGPELWTQCTNLQQQQQKEKTRRNSGEDESTGSNSSSNSSDHVDGKENNNISSPPLDMFVMSAGTGGTIAGISRYLKSRCANIKVILADPQGSSLYNKVKFGVCYTGQQKEQGVRKHRYDSIVEGVGLDRVTANFNQAVSVSSHTTSISTSISTSTSTSTAVDSNNQISSSNAFPNLAIGPSIDDAESVSDQEIVDMAHFILQQEGLLIGSSSALNLVAACYAMKKHFPPPPPSLCKEDERSKSDADTDRVPPVVVTILCDQGSRHLSRFWNADFVASVPYSLHWPGYKTKSEETTGVTSDATVDAFVPKEKVSDAPAPVMPACLRAYGVH